MHSMQHYRVKEWFKRGGDKNYRYNYNLNQRSIVVDAGGYKGDFAFEIHRLYNSYIHIFEPVPEYFNILLERFVKFPKIKVYPYALGKIDRQIHMSISNDGSSLYKSNGSPVHIQEVSTSKKFDEIGLRNVDLFKINVEGSEYDILEDLDNANWIKRIKDIQIQFHDFVENPDAKLIESHTILKKTHMPTYAFKFVWENWTKNKLLSKYLSDPFIHLELSELHEKVAFMDKMIADMREENK